MTYPCLRLCLGFSQTTRTRPFRRTILHLLQRFLTDDFTFIVFCVCERVGRGLVFGVAVGLWLRAGAFLIGRLWFGSFVGLRDSGGRCGWLLAQKLGEVLVVFGSVER